MQLMREEALLIHRLCKGYLEEDDASLRIEALNRLKWNVLASPSTVEVVDLNKAGELCWKPLSTDPKHPLAEEPVTSSSTSHIHIELAQIYYWECLGMIDKSPPPLLIHNPDGRAITVEQFVSEVSAYAQGLRGMIYETEDLSFGDSSYEDNPPPAPLLIENIDGKTITIEQFIVKVSEYAQSLRETIFECKGRAWSRYERACLWFDAVSGPKRRDAEDPDVLFYVDFTSNSWSSSNEIEADLVRKEKRFIENRSK
jgi:hypothetical protein